MIWFEVVKKRRKLCRAARNPVMEWHVAHGWAYHVWQYDAAGRGRIIGGFYVTLLCGDGGVLHFDCYDRETAACPAVLLAAMRKGLRIVEPHLSLMMATIPAELPGLIAVVCRMGFRETGDFDRDGRKIRLLKYFRP